MVPPLGDWVADTRGFGYGGAALCFGALLAVVAALYFWTRVPRTLLQRRENPGRASTECRFAAAGRGNTAQKPLSTA